MQKYPSNQFLGEEQKNFYKAPVDRFLLRDYRSEEVTTEEFTVKLKEPWL